MISLTPAAKVFALCILVAAFFSASSYGQAIAPSGPSDQPNTEAETPEASDPEQSGFFKRLFDAYWQDWKGSSAGGPEAPRRIPPAPLTSPPFPNADWNYGGASVIGASNMTSYPLMEALYNGPNGDAWKNSKVQIYGWINPGFNLSTSKHSNLPEGYNIFPNRVDLDQAVLYVERVPDSVQTEHVDWGFRAGAMYGIDYHFTTAKGWLSPQLLLKHAQHGSDAVTFNGALYIPPVAA